MALDPRIILAGQQPDFVNVLAQSNQAAQQKNQFNRENALNSLYQEQGAQIAAGDQNALNALAGFDPKAALGIQQGRQNMRINEEELNLRRQSAAREAEAWAMQQDDRTKAEQAQKIQRGLMAAGQFVAAGDQAGLDRVLQQYGIDPVPLEQFPYLAAQYEGVLQAIEGASQFGKPPAPKWKVTDTGQAINELDPLAGALDVPNYRQEPEKPADDYQRYVQEESAAGREPLSRIDFHKAKQKNSSIRVSPDGTVEVIEGAAAGGGGVTNTILTEAQRAETAYESILGGLDDYERIVTEGGGAVVPGKQKDALVSARRHLQLQMKELFNLGVLNGPDLELMDQMIVDATDPVNVGLDFVGGPGLGARTTASVAQLRKQLKQMIEPKLAQAGRSAAPQEVQSTPAPEPTPQITFQTPEQQSVFEKYSQPQR